MPRSTGFTLIELLVVIAIIGLLASVILANLNSARSKARDARRIEDLKQLQNAIELYASTNNAFPTSGTTLASTDLAGLVPTYIPSMPKDPSRADNVSTGYRYCADANGYALLADSEKTNAWCGIVQGNNPCNWNQFVASCN